MLTQAQLNEAKRLVAAAAQEFTKPPQGSFELLSEFKQEIITLRQKGATFEIIAQILADAQVSVSSATVARYCKSLPELGPDQPRRSKSAKRNQRGITAHSAGNHVSTPAALPPITPKQTSVTPRATSTHPPRNDDAADRGPRIPDLNTL